MSYRTHHTKEFFDELSLKELIEYTRSPPRDCEFNELKLAAERLADEAKKLKIAVAKLKLVTDRF